MESPKRAPRRGPTAPLTTGRPELLQDGDADFRAFVHDLLAFGSRLRDIRDGLALLIGLSGPMYTILITVAHLEESGDVNVALLTNHLSLSQPFVTAEVHKLVDAGLIDKQRSERDRRSVSLTVTPKGLGLLSELAPDQRVINDLLFESLTAEQFTALASMIPRLVRDADRALELTEHILAKTDTGRVA